MVLTTQLINAKKAVLTSQLVLRSRKNDGCGQKGVIKIDIFKIHVEKLILFYLIL